MNLSLVNSLRNIAAICHYKIINPMNGAASNTITFSKSPADNLYRPQSNLSRLPIPHTELLEAVFNTSTLGIHVLESIRNESGHIVDFYIRLTNTMSEKIAGRKVSGMRMLEGWPHT